MALLRNNKFDEISRAVPNRIADLLDCEPIESLIRHAGSDTVKAFLEAEIIKLAANFNGNPALNLKDYQVPVIADMLIENYKWESIEDFTLCFRKASCGMYGEIYRIDGAVIGQWFSRYLDEKYDALEQRKAKEKHAEKEVDLTKVTKDHIEKFGPGSEYYKEAKRIADELMSGQVKEHGPREETEFQRHKIENQYPITSEEEIVKRELHIQWIRENFDARTGQKLPSFVSESEWLKNKVKNIP